MALSLLCGGLGVASAVDVVHVNESAPGTAEVYTKTGVDNLLAEYGKKEAVETNKNNIATLQTTTMDHGQKIATNTADIANNKAAIDKKIDTATANATFATKEALDSKADKNTVTALDGRVGDVEGKVTALETTVGDASIGLVKAVNDLKTQGNDLNNALGSKADQNDLDAAKAKITTNETNITALQKKTTGLSDDGKSLTSMNSVETDALTVKGEIKNGAGVTTTLTDIKASMDKANANETAIGQLQTTTTDQQTAIDKLEEKTADISHMAGGGTNISGVTIKDGNILGNGNSAITGLTNVETGSIKTDSINGKSLTGTNVATEKNVADAVKTETDARIAADNALEGKINDEKTAREAADAKINTKIGNINDTRTVYVKDANSISQNLTTLDEKLQNTNDRTGGIKRNTEDTQTTIENKVTVNGSGDVDGVKGLSAETINTTGDAGIGGKLNVTGASDLKGDVTLGTPNGTNTVTVNGTADFNAAVKMNNGLNVINGETNLKNTTVDGDLKVTGTITTDKMVFGDKPTNYTEIDHGKVTSKNLEVNGAGQAISSSSIFNAEENKVGFANNATGDQSFHKQTSDIIMDNVKDRDNSNYRTQTKTETQDIITDKDGNSSTTSQTARENKTYLKDKDGKNTNSTIDTAKGYDKTIKGENGETSTKQDELNITNTAQKGTIKNDAMNIENNANGDMTNTVGGKLTTTVTGQATENFNGGLDTNVTGKENHTVTGDQNIHVTGKQTNEIGGDQVNIIGGNQTTTVTGDILNTAKNITNAATETLTDKVGTNTRVINSTSITDTVGTTTNRKIEDGKITDTAGDSTVTTENGKGTTFAKTTSAAYSTGTGARMNTNIAGNHITTGRVDANELGVSDKDGDNTSDFSVEAGVGKGVKASAGDGTTTGSLDVTAKEVGSSVKDDASGKGSTFKQRIDVIMGKVKTDAGESEVTQTGDEITSKVGLGEATNSRVTQKKDLLEAAVTDGTNYNISNDTANASAKVLTDGTKVNQLQDNLYSSEKMITNGTYTTSKLQTALDITNTASDGTITNDAKNIVNNATGDMTNTVGGNQTNTIGGNQTTTVTGDISNKAKNITNEASDSITDKVGDHTRVLDGDGITDTVGGSTFKQRIDKIMMESKDVSIKAEETLTNEAKVITNKASEVINNEAVNINNTATGIITSKASEIKNQADKLISNKVGENTWENMENGKITTSIKDGAKQNLTQSDAAGTTQSTVDGGKSTVTIQNADGLADAVTNGTNTSVQNQTASAIAAAVKDGAGNENASVANATTSANTIKSGSKANTVISTADGTSFINREAAAPVGDGTAVNTTIKGNTITTGKVTMDYAEVMKDLGVNRNANIGGKTTTGSLEVKGESKLTGNVTMENNATVGNDLIVKGITTTKTLKVTENAEIDGNATIKGDVTARSYKVGDKTYIDANGIHANGQKITDVADGSISEGSKDAVNGGQLYGVKRDLEHQVDKVGANAAAMANLRPMEFDPSSKWNIAAAIGNYGSETAAALGAFYRPNDDVMVNLSTAFGTGENMVGGGVSVRLGKSGNKLSREENNALKAQVDDLTARMDALLSVLNPNMSKDFPDVPENHWAYEAVSRLAGNDIVQGYPDGEFHGERTMTRYEMAEIIYNALSRGAEAEKELVEEFKPELQAMAASEKATAEKAEG